MGSSLMTCLRHHLLQDLAAASAIACGGSRATSWSTPMSSVNVRPSSERHPSRLHVAAKAAAGPCTIVHAEDLALRILAAAALYVAVMSLMLAQPSQAAVAQVLMGATWAA